MKKVLFATTALVLSAGFASADVTLSGYGRFGLQYNDSAAAGVSETTVESRMRLNIDASKETDGGVTFGGRVRVQYDNGSTASSLNAAMMYASFGGFRMEVGNANQAMDSAPLVYASELGLVSSSFGDIQSGFYAYTTGPYAAAETNRMGVSASYSMGAFSGMLSYINPDQTASSLPAGTKAEASLYLAYASGPLTVAAAGTWNAAGIDGNDIAFIGAAYQVNDAVNVGLNYTDEVVGETIVGYGSYKMGATTLRGYIANNSDPANATDTAYGIGADYDLGGATLLGGIQKGYAKETVADFGVKFAF
ncbi:porin [uncultured Thioclava sp.]|uniref:porin n=1 Tax=uncultured Thioclava sp. TaxID=473858 RepID=UPI0025D729CC|nr:porin [uncultured Thioclava sp.]